MLESYKYINHLEETLYFGSDNVVFVNNGSLRDFRWDVLSQRDKISGFTRGIQSKSFPVRIGTADSEQGTRKANAVYEIPEKDIVAGIPGRLFVNRYYLRCYITASEKTFYTVDGQRISQNLEVTTDQPNWIMEIPVNTDWSWFNNENFAPVNFRLEVGRHLADIENPSFNLGGNLYQINTTLPMGTRMIIDSLEERAYFLYENGYEESVFNYRNRDHWIFEKIPVGRNVMNKSSGISDFSLVLYYERSEPEWSVIESARYVSWNYDLQRDTGDDSTEGHVIESTYDYSTDSGILLAINSNGHLIQTKADKYFNMNLINDFKLEEENLVVYHD